MSAFGKTVQPQVEAAALSRRLAHFYAESVVQLSPGLADSSANPWVALPKPLRGRSGSGSAI